MEELGRKMIAWCQGIPLAVLVLRGILVTKNTLHEWERFYERRTREEEHEQLNGEVVNLLSYSYNELPYPLKPCFLYLSNFLEDQEIEAEMLYMLWDAEGMILSKDREKGETMMDVAERYLAELVGRSMVEAELKEEVHPNVRRRFKSCRLHDLVRELCLSIVKKENFLKVNDYRARKDRVLVLDSSCLGNASKAPARQAFYFEGREFSVKQKATPHVRSLMFVHGRPRKLSNLKFSMLRVLNLVQMYSAKEDFPKELIHLKYLSFHFCKITKLPLSIGNLIFLQSLDLEGFSHDDPISNVVLRKLTRLRHLFLRIRYKVLDLYSVYNTPVDLNKETTGLFCT